MIMNVSPKKWLLMGLGAIFLSGCATTATDPSRQNVGTTGLLICAKNELCPLVTVSWNESNKELLKLKIHLSSTYNKYDIQKVEFTNEQKSQSFAVTGSTEHDHVLGANRSTNYILAPVNLMGSLKGTSSIKMNIYTDKGIISRYVYKDGVSAPILGEFQKVYQ